MSLQPASFEEAKLKHKPMKRGRIAPGTPTLSRKPVSLSRGKKTATAKRKRKGNPKKKAWAEFSRFIRTRMADAQGMVACVTCGVKKHWKEMQAGHFIAGRLNSNLFDDRGCHAQCYGCNVGRNGNMLKYYRFMASTFGEDVITELERQNDETRKWKAGELQEIAARYAALNATNPLLEKL